MAEFAIFDKVLRKQSRRGSAPPPRSRSQPRSTALVTYNAKPEDEYDYSRRQSVTEVVQLDGSRRSSSPKLAFVRHKGESNDRGYQRRTLAFAEAASILYYTLRKATVFCEDFETSFRFETQHIRYWSPRSTVDMLWRVKTDWDGVEFERYEHGVDSKEFYNKHTVLVRQAWDDLKYAQPVSREAFESSRSRLGPVEIKTAMKNLRAIVHQIEDLWEAVRADRTQMRSLIHQLKDGMDALNDIEVVWNRPEYGGR